MNEFLNTDRTSDVPWPTSDTRVHSPEPASEPQNDAATPAAGAMQTAVQGAHATIDRIADGAAPIVHRLGERVSAAEETLHAKALQLRDTGEVWVEGVRTIVRSNPLVCVAAAVTLGVVLAGITRIGRTRH